MRRANSHRDLAPVEMNGKWGYIDRSGKLLISSQFDFAAPFSSDGRALVGTNGTLGYVKKDGRYAIQPTYTGAGGFGGQLAPVLG